MNESLPAPLERQRRIPKKMKQALDALLSRRVTTITAAAELVGYSREHLSREIGRPHIRAYYLAKIERGVLLTAGRAVGRLEELVDAESEHVSLDASRYALAVAGIRPAPDRMSVDVNIRAGYVIDLTGPGGPPMKVVGGELAAAPQENGDKSPRALDTAPQRSA